MVAIQSVWAGYRATPTSGNPSSGLGTGRKKKRLFIIIYSQAAAESSSSKPKLEPTQSCNSTIDVRVNYLRNEFLNDDGSESFDAYLLLLLVV